MNTRFLWRSPSNKPRWIILLLLGVLAALATIATAAYFKSALAKLAVGIAQTASPTLSVDVRADRHSISPDIYGMNDFAIDPALAKELRIPVERWGANHTSRYNWLVDSSNVGDDFFFVGGGDNKNPIPGDSTDKIVKTNRNNGSKSIVTIPMIGYVNKFSTWNCGFRVSKYGAQEKTNPYIFPEGDKCGNGKRPDGTLITNNNRLDVSIVSNPDFQKAWVQHLVKTHGTAAKGGVQIYQMDNEPSGWGNTHRDVHPEPTSYDELRDRTFQYASMVKATDPTAKILGPSDFGWPVYVDSGVKGDREKHGGVWFARWYLQQMRAYEQQKGVRILDYFDEHYYPLVDDLCLANCPAGDAKTQAARLRSTRSLWDSTYTDESWIGKSNPPLTIIPRFREWVKQDYPGTKVAITEYNWGGLESMNGALTQAEILGIFGREQLDLATLWGPPKSSEPGAYAFRTYMNYDGKGGKYGETWVRSQSTDLGQLSIYGAQRTQDGALTLVIINKTSKNLTSNLSLKGFNPGAKAQVYTYSEANLRAIVRQNDLSVSAAGFQATYPANSITLVAIPKAKA
ncbi:MAG: glycoside hydrolase family 44 protein [Microcoleus sp. PH2017_40_RAT_O_B]|uniref:glycoside hydrolase family 44 protein n=1 Tax=unclassified Microcoleus TaxID=2642155 RepID=UPI001DBDB157|nr:MULTISPECIES: glycoside hydrolase family 44 protein [unclassified Microcoleus]MCC3575910.1 glycoside hydrolase family 44 protein [Microcoleus sp. PH2017_34_RAT_O_A]MCC3613673.1 glycoside hydrolase family 44 protein [Microcoleus sp. PH2017_40_RAT_O_B]